jgi:hypothetical protein
MFRMNIKAIPGYAIILHVCRRFVGTATRILIGTNSLLLLTRQEQKLRNAGTNV